MEIRDPTLIMIILGFCLAGFLLLIGKILEMIKKKKRKAGGSQ